ncbi:hypothetical protein [Rhizobium sp. AG855]|uniref:hypothetical protein n=1 Tax=Rhizobium sp. AG855 TaxID=2183898 RepID=UPI000FF3358A|nr:hypothetical protein [Rhizobium sp. AG855]RKE84273.1 hypothetical protein DFO46_1038 [Rhizobium sp. AG855]
MSFPTKSVYRLLIGVFAASLAFQAGSAFAESYQGLLKKGYTVGKMSQGKSGSLGWVLTGKDGKQFCKSKVSLAVVDKKTLVSILASGRMVKVDRATFEAGIGGPDPSLPLLSDLKAGRVGPQHVGACTPLRG